MQFIKQILEATRSLRWWKTFPFLLALLTFGFLIWSIFLAVSYPFDGIIDFLSSGLIREIDSSSPSSSVLEVGDIIVQIDRVPIEIAYPFYKGKQPGDLVEFVVDRGGKEIVVSFPLVKPSSDEIFRRLVPLFIAFTFWVVGVVLQVFKPADRSADVFFLFCQVSCAFLTAGAISWMGPPWVFGLFNFLIWLIGPLTVHFHLYFPQLSLLKSQRFLMVILYFIAFVGGLPYLVISAPYIRFLSWYPWLVSIGRLFLSLNLLIVVYLLFYSYRHANTSGVRSKIRIVVLGGVLGAIPLVALTILPDGLLRQPLIPYQYAFLFVVLVPLTYGYAIFRHKLIEIDKHVNRGVTYILIYSLLGGFYFVLYFGIHTFIPSDFGKEPLINTFLVLILATAFVPLYRVVQRVVDTLFYGGWYDYRSALASITKGLEQITELQTLADTICDRLVQTLRLEDTCVFFRDLDGEFSVIGVAPRSGLGNSPPRGFSPLPKSSLTYLLKVGAVEKTSLRKSLSMVALTPEERQLLESEQVHLWVPVIGHGQILGLLALGQKYGGDIFGGEDMDILRLVARQVAPLVENIHLVTRLKRHALELEQRVEERTAELHSAKERVEAILSSVGDGVVVTDLDWNIITINAAFERQVGCPASQIIGQKLWSFVNVGDSPEIIDEIQRTINLEAIWTGELINYTVDGVPYDVQLTITPVSNHEKNIIGYVGSQRDITRHKQLERIKDRLIFDVSHELRTPVTNLSLYLELLESGKTDKWSEYIGILKGETNRLIELIENVLDLSRLDMWKSKKMKFSMVDLNTIVEQVVSAHRPLAESSGLELHFEPQIQLPMVYGEQNQLARLVTNLLSNAIRYTPSGKVIVRTKQECDQVSLQVQDTGIGIEAEDMPHIFERFYRGRQVSQSKITGTGLGLAIVKEIVEIHEGRIEVQSDVGKGSLFTVWLPVSKGES